jgi:protein TonB
MFDEMVISSPNPKKTNKWWTMLVSSAFEIGFLAILILIPLIYTEALPKTMMATMLTAPPPPPPPPPPPVVTQVVRVKPQVHLMDAGKLMQPRAIPKETKIIKEEAEPDMASVGAVGGVPGGVAGGSMGGVLGGVLGGILGGIGHAPPPAPPRPTPVAHKGPYRVGGKVQAPRLIRQVQPEYPPLAKQARIQGDVVIDSVIDTQGRVTEMEVVSGSPLLVQSAIQALGQWRYQPKLLNGQPVAVDMLVTLHFTLGQNS